MNPLSLRAPSEPPDDPGCSSWRRLAPRLAAAGVRRLVLVGGSPVGARTVRRWAEAHGIEVRLVEGTRRHTARRAADNRAWGDRFLIWASTPLDHRVSALYCPSRTGGRTITIHARGAHQVAAELERWLGGGRP
jgi:hypothetical protein